MMVSYWQILCVSLVAVTATLSKIVDPEQDNGDNGDNGIGGPVNYEFGYNVHDPDSEDVKSHHEIRDGENVYGFYTFKEADGSVRVVKYKVGPTSGFEANVERLKPGQRIVITKPGDGQDPGNGQDAGYVQENGQAIPQYVGGGSRTQYVLGIVNNPLQDVPVQADVGQGQQTQGRGGRQGYKQTPAVPSAYGQRRGGRQRNQYVAPNLPQGYGWGQRQVHGQGQAYTQPRRYNRVYGNQYPAQPAQTRNYVQRPVNVRAGRRRNQASHPYVNPQPVQVIGYIPNGGGQVVNQPYTVVQEAQIQENADDQGINADVKDEAEQEAEDEFEEEFKSALEDEEDEEQAEEEEHLEAEEGEEENAEEATEAQENKSS